MKLMVSYLVYCRVKETEPPTPISPYHDAKKWLCDRSEHEGWPESHLKAVLSVLEESQHTSHVIRGKDEIKTQGLVDILSDQWFDDTQIDFILHCIIDRGQHPNGISVQDTLLRMPNVQSKLQQELQDQGASRILFPFCFNQHW